MIKVKHTETSLEINGHANFAKKGNDIVCAAVSAIVETAASWFKKGELSIKLDKKKAVLRYDLIKKTTENKNKLALIVTSLQMLAKKYKKYIKIMKGK